MRTPLILAILILFAHGCGAISRGTMHIGPKAYPPRPAGYDIAVFISTDAPNEVRNAIPHARSASDLPPNAVVIGRVEAYETWMREDWGEMAEKAKDGARELGGDAIVLNEWNYPIRLPSANALVMTVVRYRE